MYAVHVLHKQGKEIVKYCVTGRKDQSETHWIKHRRPVRILDWELWGRTLPQPRGTLTKCVSNDVETTKIIKEWHTKVDNVLRKRGLASFV